MDSVRTLITFVPTEFNDSGEDVMQKIIKTSQNIFDKYNVTTSLYVYEKDDRNRSVFITYKATVDDSQKEPKIDGTYFINRNAKTNTFFSINALNRICLKEIGRQDPTHRVNWDNYKDMIFIIKTNKNGEKILVENKIFRVCIVTIDNGIITVE